MENPAEGEPIKLSKLALLIFYPESVSFENGVVKLTFPPKWLGVDDDHSQFSGPNRTWTGRLIHAMDALYQMSYGPNVWILP